MSTNCLADWDYFLTDTSKNEIIFDSKKNLNKISNVDNNNEINTNLK